jgi:hypothetical protein
MRLRTACDLEPVNREKISANRPAGFVLPSLTDLEKELPGAIEAGKELMNRTTVAFEDELKKGKDTDDAAAPTADNDQDATEDAQNEKD